VSSARRIRIGYPGPQGFGELPSFLANRELEARGYTIETTFYVQPELAVQALVEGSIDLSVGSSRIYWVAVQHGAPLVAVIEGARRNHVLVATKPIASCHELAGRRVGLTGLAAMGATLFREYLRSTCPGTEVETILIAGSPNRIAALMTGTIDATVSFRAEAVDLARRAPDRFEALGDFELRWADLISSAIFVNSARVADRTEDIDLYVKTMLEANRRLSTDAGEVARRASALMPPGHEYGPVAEAYVSVEAWDSTGGLSPEGVKKTMDFLVSIGELKDPLPESRLVDRSFLTRARADLSATP
jgi:ABC-type nitrate/sulfonate/bicarbonate transport system substrate-binding protein